MGYDTKISGKAVFDEKLSVELIDYIKRFNQTRHVLRDAEKIKKEDKDWQKRVPFMELDDECVFYAPGNDEYARYSIINNNKYPSSVPNFYCPWTLEVAKKDKKEYEAGELSEATAELVPDGCEKPYGYEEYMKFIIDNFFEPLGYDVHGAFLAIGEEFGDAQYIIVSGSTVKVHDAYLDSSIDEIRNYITNSMKDKKTLKIFNDISVSSMYLEDYWCD